MRSAANAPSIGPSWTTRMSSTFPSCAPSGPTTGRPSRSLARMTRPRNPVDEVVAHCVLRAQDAQLSPGACNGHRAVDVGHELEADAIRLGVVPVADEAVGRNQPVAEDAAEARPDGCGPAQ